jgi:hypothetical protein
MTCHNESVNAGFVLSLKARYIVSPRTIVFHTRLRTRINQRTLHGKNTGILSFPGSCEIYVSIRMSQQTAQVEASRMALSEKIRIFCGRHDTTYPVLDRGVRQSTPGTLFWTGGVGPTGISPHYGI